MAKPEKNQKVPGALIIVIIVLVAILPFYILVWKPYNDKKEPMQSDHDSVMKEIAGLDSEIARQDEIEADIAQMEKDWAKYREEMFIEPKAVLDDLQANAKECNIYMPKFEQENPEEYSPQVLTPEGNPLCFTEIDIKDAASTREDLIKFLDYIEHGSKGKYYITSFKTDLKDSDTEVQVKEEDSKKNSDTDTDSDTEEEPDLEPITYYETSMTIRLFYFDQKKTYDVQVEEEATDSAAE